VKGRYLNSPVDWAIESFNVLSLLVQSKCFGLVKGQSSP
jgi:hypothetical protein